MTGHFLYIDSMRQKSSKPVLALDEACLPFHCVLKNPNHPDGVMVNVNGNRRVYPLDKDVVIERPHWAALKAINYVRHFIPEYDYNPFKDHVYAKS